MNIKESINCNSW